MKKLVGASLFIFWAFVAAILTAGLVFYQNNANSPLGNSILPSETNNPNQGKEITLDATEISKHNSTRDCWLIVNNKVYDVTGYLGVHPGGVGTIAPYCGKDATLAFDTKDSGRPHSGYANSLLASYYIGDLNQKIGASNQTGQHAQNIDPSPQTEASPAAPDPASQSPVPASQTTLDAAEIAKHGSTSDCWIIISGKVYNVTSYLRAHPGGVGTIAPYCGKDATQAFQGQGHSSYANSLLSSYFIGNLDQSVSTAQIQQSIQNINIAPPPTTNRRGHDYEYGDD